jgi:transcriptional regulator with XRE-family HTH domain
MVPSRLHRRLGHAIHETSRLANGLAERYRLGMAGELSGRLAANVRHLREARGLTQEQMAKLSGIPRATWGHLESGAANPTLSVLHRVALALQVPLEELTSAPRAACRYYPRKALPGRRQGDAVVRELLPDPVPGMVIDRMAIAPHGRMTGVPHMPGTREYLTCESGQIRLAVAGEQWTLDPGDVVVFRGDQRHSYANPGAREAVGYSVVLLAPVS